MKLGKTRPGTFVITTGGRGVAASTLFWPKPNSHLGALPLYIYIHIDLITLVPMWNVLELRSCLGSAKLRQFAPISASALRLLCHSYCPGAKNNANPHAELSSMALPEAPQRAQSEFRTHVLCHLDPRIRFSLTPENFLALLSLQIQSLEAPGANKRQCPCYAGSPRGSSKSAK